MYHNGKLSLVRKIVYHIRQDLSSPVLKFDVQIFMNPMHAKTAQSALL